MEQVVDVNSRKGNFIPKENTSKYRVLLAENDADVRNLIADALEHAGYETVLCRDGLDLLDHVSIFLFPHPIKSKRIDLIISNLFLPGVTGMEILEGVQSIDKFPPIILLSGFNMGMTFKHASHLGAAAIFKPPLDLDGLMKKVKTICESVHPETGMKH